MVNYSQVNQSSSCYSYSIEASASYQLNKIILQVLHQKIQQYSNSNSTFPFQSQILLTYQVLQIVELTKFLFIKIRGKANLSKINMTDIEQFFFNFNIYYQKIDVKYNQKSNQMKKISSQRNKKTRKSKNEDYLFVLQKIGNQDPKRIVTCLMNPIKIKNTKQNSFPCFNMDRNFHTPCFILPCDKEQYSNSGMQYLHLQNNKIKQSQTNSQEIFIARPSRNNSYCSVCKSKYEDYQEHIQSQNHKKLLSEHSLNKFFKRLCDKFQKINTYNKMDRPQLEQDYNQTPKKKRKTSINYGETEKNK